MSYRLSVSGIFWCSWMFWTSCWAGNKDWCTSSLCPQTHRITTFVILNSGHTFSTSQAHKSLYTSTLLPSVHPLCVQSFTQAGMQCYWFIWDVILSLGRKNNSLKIFVGVETGSLTSCWVLHLRLAFLALYIHCNSFLYRQHYCATDMHFVCMV